MKGLSFRKFFGSYLHTLIPHASLQIRIVSEMTAFAESEKRLFQQAKSISKRTATNQPGNIISNMATKCRRCSVCRFRKSCSYTSSTSLSSLEFTTGTDIPTGTMATSYS